MDQKEFKNMLIDLIEQYKESVVETHIKHDLPYSENKDGSKNVPLDLASFLVWLKKGRRKPTGGTPSQ